MAYTLSTITSSTSLPLDQIHSGFKELETVEVYLARQSDLEAIGLEDSDLSLAEIVSEWKPRTRLFSKVRKLVSKGGTPKAVSIATYLPEISSADNHVARFALSALKNILQLANAWGVSAVELVCGRLAEECRRGIDCQAVIFDASNVQNWRARKIQWIFDALEELHEYVLSWDHARTVDIALALELEPGLLFVLQDPEDAARLLRLTANLKLKRKTGKYKGQEYNFVQMNADLGHFRLLGQDIHPAKLWSSIFPDYRVGTPWNRVANFHISDHPYNLIHCDCPPGHIDTSVLRSYVTANDEDKKCIEGFAPWLNCFLCIAENAKPLSRTGLNISLELEGETDPSHVIKGLNAIAIALTEITAIRKEHQPKLSGLCTLYEDDGTTRCPCLADRNQ